MNNELGLDPQKKKTKKWFETKIKKKTSRYDGTTCFMGLTFLRYQWVQSGFLSYQRYLE